MKILYKNIFKKNCQSNKINYLKLFYVNFFYLLRDLLVLFIKKYIYFSNFMFVLK